VLLQFVEKLFAATASDVDNPAPVELLDFWGTLVTQLFSGDEHPDFRPLVQFLEGLPEALQPADGHVASAQIPAIFRVVCEAAETSAVDPFHVLVDDDDTQRTLGPWLLEIALRHHDRCLFEQDSPPLYRLVIHALTSPNNRVADSDMWLILSEMREVISSSTEASQKYVELALDASLYALEQVVERLRRDVENFHGVGCPEELLADQGGLSSWRNSRDLLGFEKELEELLVTPLLILRRGAHAVPTAMAESFVARLGRVTFSSLYFARQFAAKVLAEGERVRGPRAFGETSRRRTVLFPCMIMTERLMVESSQMFAEADQARLPASLAKIDALVSMTSMLLCSVLARSGIKGVSELLSSIDDAMDLPANPQTNVLSAARTSEYGDWFSEIRLRYSDVLDGTPYFLYEPDAFLVFNQLCELLGRSVSQCADIAKRAQESSSAFEPPGVRLAWLGVANNVCRGVALFCGTSVLPTAPSVLREEHTLDDIASCLLRSISVSVPESSDHIAPPRSGLEVIFREPVPFPVLGEGETEEDALSRGASAFRDRVVGVFSAVCGLVALNLATQDRSSIARALLADFAGALGAAMESTDRSVQALATKFFTDLSIHASFFHRELSDLPPALQGPAAQILARGDSTATLPSANGQEASAASVGATTDRSSSKKRRLERETSADFASIARSPHSAQAVMTEKQALKRMKLESQSYVPRTGTSVDASQSADTAFTLPGDRAERGVENKREDRSLDAPATPGAAPSSAGPTVTPQKGFRLEASLRHATAMSFEDFAPRDLLQIASLCASVQSRVLEALQAQHESS
jgi:hypothetical protein